MFGEASLCIKPRREQQGTRAIVLATELWIGTTHYLEGILCQGLLRAERPRRKQQDVEQPGWGPQPCHCRGRTAWPAHCLPLCLKQPGEGSLGRQEAEVPTSHLEPQAPYLAPWATLPLFSFAAAPAMSVGRCLPLLRAAARMLLLAAGSPDGGGWPARHTLPCTLRPSVSCRARG